MMFSKLLFVAGAAGAALVVEMIPKKHTLGADGHGTLQVHPDRAASIAKVNSAETTWRAAPHPRFARQAPGASSHLLGHLGSNKLNVAAAKARGELVDYVPRNPSKDIPDTFDAAENWPNCATLINDIRDQSNCGCCWAFGGAEAASDRMCIATDGDMNLPISAQDVCFNSNINGCGGGQITTPWTFIRSKGAVSGGQYNGTGPFGLGMCSNWGFAHCHHHGPQGSDPYPAEGDPGCPSDRSPSGPTACDDTATGEHTSYDDDKYSFNKMTETASGEENIQQMIMEGGSVETAFTVYTDFEDYDGGIYQYTTGSMAGGHAVKITGWGVEDGTKYWKIANSWNPYWGEDGFFRILRGSNECGVEDQVTGSPSDATWSKKSAAL
mmetsp:Transcript_34610/g.107011  ORF Transcript_34610/g.107011 Transcript_34610/m.107011 type:complete len:382 (+) Transcript_34610:62-1207(+)